MAVNENFGAIPTNRSVARLTASQWEDIQIPSSSMALRGADDPTRGSTSGLLEFSGTADNVVCGAIILPYEWQEASALVPHLHLRFPNAPVVGSDTRWKLEYDIADADGNFANAYGSYTAHETITVANPSVAARHVRAAFSSLATTGKHIGAVLLWKLSRLAASDAADTDEAACVLLSLDFHMQQDSIGSTDSTTK